MAALEVEPRRQEAQPVAPPPVQDVVGPPIELRSVLRAVGSIVAPTTLLTSLLYYFGFAHSASFLRYFGLDISLLGLSTQDYLIRSVDVLFVPLVVTFTVGSLILWAQGRLLDRISAAPDADRRLRLASIVLATTGLVVFVVGLTGIFVIESRARFGLQFPLCFGAGAVLIAYASRLHARSERSTTGRAGGRSTALLEVAGAFLLVSLSLFWASTNYGAAVGTSRARQFEREFRSYPEAIVYSKESLHLEAPGVTETSCAEPAGGFRFRYDGLRLMIRSAGKYFLLPEAWTRDGGVALVVPESDAVRLQFIARPSTAPATSPGIKC